MANGKMEPYPQELKEKLYMMKEANPGVPVSELLKELFAKNPKFAKFKKRLTPQRAHAAIGMMRRQKNRRESTTDTNGRKEFIHIPQSEMLYSKILGTASALKHDGKRPKVILKNLQEKFPDVMFPPARALMQLLFKNGRPKRTPVKKYAIEGDGFRIEIMYHNPRVREKVAQIVGLLLD